MQLCTLCRHVAALNACNILKVATATATFNMLQDAMAQATLADVGISFTLSHHICQIGKVKIKCYVACSLYHLQCLLAAAHDQSKAAINLDVSSEHHDPESSMDFDIIAHA
jgi:hypothetical protein